MGSLDPIRLAHSARASARSVYHQARKHILHADIHEAVTRVTLKHLARYQRANEIVAGRELVDAACGSGYGAMLMSQAATYQGVDLDSRAVASARREFGEFSFVQGSVFDLPYDAGAMGAVTSFETLEHIPEPDLAVSEFARVLQPGGLLIASIPINHPDRIYHLRPYSAVEAMEILASDARMEVVSVHAQHDLVFQELYLGDASLESAAGTLYAVLRRRI